MQYHSARKSEEILPSVTPWKDPEGIMLSEIGQTDKYCVSSLTCGT